MGKIEFSVEELADGEGFVPIISIGRPGNFITLTADRVYVTEAGAVEVLHAISELLAQSKEPVYHPGGIPSELVDTTEHAPAPHETKAP